MISLRPFTKAYSQAAVCPKCRCATGLFGEKIGSCIPATTWAALAVGPG